MSVEKVIPILNDEYKVVFITGDWKHIHKTVLKWGYPDFDPSCMNNLRGMTFHKRGLHPIIALKRLPVTAEEFGTLSHEAVHAVDDVFTFIGDDNRDELFAHSVGAIVRGVLEVKKK